MTFIKKILIFTILMMVFLTVHITNGIARFTKVPPLVLYVSVGETAHFVWDYIVDDREKDFQEFSPKWSFYRQNNSKSIIGYELVFHQRKWTINKKTCPKRLLNPTRVSIESNATLVIHNATVSDSGTYGCSLELTTENPITSKATLVVTTRPKLSITTANASTLKIREGGNRDVRCSAIGIPTPNVTWIKKNIGNITMSEGVGNATLRIKNITEHQGGRYECQASNNPNEKPVTLGTKIVVLVNAKNDTDKSSTTASSFRVSTEFLKRSTDVEGTTNVARKVSTQSPVVDDHNGNKPTNNEGTTRVTNRASIQATIRRRRQRKSTKRLVGGIIGIGLLVAVAIGLTLAILTNKTCLSRKKDETPKGRNNMCPSVMGDTDEREIPIYAQIDASTKKTNGLQEDVVPIYAQVDKRKKRRPGQIIYAELEDFQQIEGIPSGVIFPPEYTKTEYADIQGLSGQVNDEPIFERL